MAKRDERMKASDVFNEASMLFGKTASFSAAFPSIAELHVEVEEKGDHGPSWSSRTVYTHHNPPGEFVNCRNPRCFNGGFRIAQMIRYMAYSQDTEHDATVRCQGYEGSPKGRKNSGPCDQYFVVRIRVKYKAESKD
jgi:hypothetical protein